MIGKININIDQVCGSRGAAKILNYISVHCVGRQAGFSMYINIILCPGRCYCVS